MSSSRSHGGQEADRPEVDAEDGNARMREVTQRVEDAAVSAEHEADIGLLSIVDPSIRWRRPRASRARRRSRRAPPAALAASAAAATASADASGCAWRDQRDALHRRGHGSTSSRAGIESRRPRPLARGPDEGLAVPLRAR